MRRDEADAVTRGGIVHERVEGSDEPRGGYSLKAQVVDRDLGIAWPGA
ncbi:hypothetical protein [Pigmentiphaga sp.]|nr:hypothetical protein [Pigmentiphaga sp.]